MLSAHRRRTQAGYTLVPALAILTILFMLGSTFLFGVFRFQAKKTRHEESSMTASAIAEAGLQRALAQLTAAAGDITGTFFDPSQRVALQQAVTDPVTGRVIGSFDAHYEDGSLIGAQTITGSTVAGYDGWGNQIWWDATTQSYNTTTNTRRFGIKVDGYATHPDGTRKPGGQSVYVRAVMNSPQSHIGLDQPANYVLYSNANLTIVNGAGLYGGLTHTNGQLSLLWRSPGAGSFQHVGAIDAYSPLSFGTMVGYWYTHAHAHSGNHAHTSSSLPAFRPYGRDLQMLHPYYWDAADYSSSRNRAGNDLHQHPIDEANSITAVLANTSFINFGSPAYEYHPKQLDIKHFPTFAIDPLLQMTKPEGGALSDYDKGYWVGNADFRATYFGNDLRFTADAGSPPVLDPERLNPSYADIALIYVNDNSASGDFMKVSASPKTTDYKAYTYRQIPPNGLLLVKDGEVKIGNYVPIAPATGTGVVVPGFGGNTIIDGRLSIVSYATNSPGAGPNGAPNAGDIQICGNVIYRNKVYWSPGLGARQYLPSDPTPGSLTSSTTKWVTTTDGEPVTTMVNDEAVPVGKVCSLALFASNNIRVPVSPYWVRPDAETLAHTDNLRVMAQLIAGGNPAFTPQQKEVSSHFRITHQDDRNLSPSDRLKWPDPISAYDTFRVFGAVSSFNSPLTSYFSDRDYIFDRALSAMPMPGQPLIHPPKTFTNLPIVIPGSWTQMPAS